VNKVWRCCFSFSLWVWFLCALQSQTSDGKIITEASSNLYQHCDNVKMKTTE
jgi:hypothetical protein